MALDRWIALVILMISLAYGYTAFFTMDEGLPPFMKFNAIWPSTFPKGLSVMAVICALIILLSPQKADTGPKAGDIDYRRLLDYKLAQALSLLAMMVVYALALRPVGFLISTVAFLVISAMILGERKLHILIPIAVIAAGVVWYLVQQVLGIYLRPLPFFLGHGG
ncbi:tripartite tricarboxylate transporter TctB family protein [Phaeobacter gallaeciensis]|uniref:Tripartite tricarboxylate transporter TctB family protein n=1 Tax=Phaeobacter gallaeciensis TaxID=60890 RepID=A0AAD0EC59_9RHOB|nr:tripartite tricarboxylate transporter TctB family protein [Phaeobacter gallaeciensis]AHD10430.1 Tripartite tricarboxylate transporter TctB family [Phaeobacter gallaeciensis DSM 26640]ATE93693.1 Tripartite tricarboxylate transporter TctB family protein [Phaeobacter gallaeciensis]ATE96486.1 Tripartite tricarboxylate transporter TctB family protein [Phaeobacter gallaeciensis]ATF02357.1 Tripartite tricarboxylate transporter TctB family protein [Phaeobacter gallaeciensis]ATF06737.1 Tripartite tr